MNWQDIQPKVTSLQDRLLTTMSEIRHLAGEESQIPRIDGNFDIAEKILSNKEYDVVVCGEVKKGKSSLINAIIGQQVLPVDSDIATSQVFKISNTQDGKEHFSLCFTDGTSRSIDREELSKYGSQVVANESGAPDLEGKSISYIKVELPAAFLPSGVNIVDTPGLGALYKSHEFITQSYVRKAAAVVFVLDYEKPIVEQELLFINKVLDVTPYILFVITKTDRYTDEVKEKIISRDNEILAEIFESRKLKAPAIYPISSTSLMGASHKKIEKIRMASMNASGFTEVHSELMKLIYRAVGLLRTDNAISAVVNYVNRVNNVIGDILNSCRTDSQSIQQQVEKEKREVQEDFKNRWNAQSANYNDIKNRIYQICDNLIIQANSLASTSGDLFQSYIKQIDKIDSFSIDSAKSLAINLPKEFVDELPQRWDNLARNTISEVACILYEAQSKMNKTPGHKSLGFNSTSDYGLSHSDKTSVVRNTLGGGMLIVGVVNLIFNPGAWVLIIVGLLAAVIFGTDAVLQQIKSRTKQKLSELLAQGSSQIQSYARELAGQLRIEAMRSLQESFDNRKDDIQKELEEIQRRGEMQIEEKKSEFNKWMSIKSKWDSMTSTIRQLIEQRKEIVTSLN